GKVEPASQREYGKATIHVENGGRLFDGLPEAQVVCMSHADLVTEVPAGFTIDASSDHCPISAMSNTDKHLYAVQVHPEVRHSVYGN
ncbi:gamma-glutamyl-gamma-aminobutyrate hydrolase family protein, partial [[Eubacterium] rectale]